MRPMRPILSLLALLSAHPPPAVAASYARDDFAAHDGVRYDPAAEAPTPDVTLAGGTSFRHLVAYLPFSSRGSLQPGSMYPDVALGALLAVHHFNGGIDSVVPRIKNATAERCPDLKFTLEFADTDYSPIGANRHLFESVLPRAERPYDPARPYPTALLGATRSAVSMPLHQLAATSAGGLVQVSPMSTATALDNKGEYPLFGRTIPSTIGDAAAAVDYLAGVLGVTHLGVLHVQDSYGFSYTRALQQAASRRDPPIRTLTSSLPFQVSDSNVDDGPLVKAVTRLRESGYRYFFGVWFIQDHGAVMRELHRQGLTGKGYFWMWGDSLEALPDYRIAPPAGGGGAADDDSNPVAAATTGGALLTLAKPSVLVESGVPSACVEEWKHVPTEATKSYLRSALPSHLFESEEGRDAWDGIRLSDIPTPSTATLYDATMAIQLAACELHSAGRSREGRETHRTPVTFTGPELYKAYLNTTFDGCSGQVITDPVTGTRDYKSMAYSVTNLVANEPDDDSGVVTFSAITTGLYNKGVWNDVGSREFVYSDGTTVPPDALPPLAAPHDPNFISPILQGFGWTLCGVVLLLSVGWAVWTYKLRNSPVVKASQPIFLYMLCLGALFMGSAIVPISLQETDVSDPGSLNVACMAVPWLLSFGFTLSFSALEAKLRRVNMILGKADQFRRVKVLPKDVIKPLVLLLSFDLAILTAWTVVNPLRWHRVDIPGAVDGFDRSTASYGTCFPPKPTGESIALVSLWAVINVIALIYANVQAYRGRSLSTEYSEAHYIRISMAFLLQAVIIGAPLGVVSKESPTARFIVLALIIVIVCLSILVPVFVPKMIYYRAWKAKEAEKAEKKRMRLKRMEDMAKLAEGDEPERTGMGSTAHTAASSGYGVETRGAEPLHIVKMHASLSRQRTENLLLKQQSRRLQQEITSLSQRNINVEDIIDEDTERQHVGCFDPAEMSTSPPGLKGLDKLEEEKEEETE